MNFSRKRISPKAARELLDNQFRNRPLRSIWVNELARRMAEGLWETQTGDSIKVNAKGQLLDGQHRLEAVCLCGKTFTFTIASGIPQEAQEFLDQAKTRTAADDLAMHGVKQATFIAAAIRICLLYEDRSLLGDRPGRRAAYSPREIRRYFNQNTELAEYAKNATGVKIVPASNWIFLRKLFTDIDPEAANTFLGRLRDGVALDSMSPIYALRRQLLREKEAPRKSDRLSRVGRLAICIKAWNAWRDGKKSSRIVYKKGEKFPLAA